MTVIASCGDELTEEEGLGRSFYVKDYAKDGSKCVSYRVLCTKCITYYQDTGLILDTEEHEEAWLGSK
jgi:hypothetical protein